MRFLLAAALLVLAACSPAAQTGKPVVAVSHYPVEYLVREIAGDTVDVVVLRGEQRITLRATLGSRSERGRVEASPAPAP